MNSKYCNLLLCNLFIIALVVSKSCHCCREDERKALLKVKQNMELYNKNGTIFSYWSGNDCCSWQGILCSNITGSVNGVMLLSWTESTMDSNVLLPLLSLHNLTNLSLYGSYFSGSKIPEFFGSFKALESLTLYESGFSGRVPDELGNLTALQSLDIYGDNSLLFIDNAEWLSRLKSLDSLALVGVNMSKASGWLQALNSLPNITSISLSNCELKSLPPLSYVNFTSLTSLYLFGNEIYGEMPNWLGGLHNLTALSISNEFLYGSVPEYIGNLTLLESLDLSSNQLNGSLPTTIGDLSSLRSLSLSGNKLDGSLPPSIGNLSVLESLQLSLNELEGWLPASIGDLSLLKTIDISSNKMEGRLPETIGNLSSLKSIQLSHNELSGSLPDTIGKLSFLEMLSLQSNQLNGTIPQSIGQLNSLQSISMFNNSLRGSLTEEHFANLSKLTTIILAYNSLVFDVSDHWNPPFQLQILDIDLCLVGPRFPDWLRTQQSLFFVSLMGTGIEGSVPNWFPNSSPVLGHLDLSHNKISGGVSQFFHSSLFNIILSDNLLSGALPTNSSNLTYFEFLDLSNNNLHSKLPPSFCDLKNLVLLWLSENKLSGELPNCWNISTLKYIDFSQNYFYGKIPSSLCNMPNLLNLHLGYNFFSDVFPACLVNTTSLVTLDLSHNKLIGNIPSWTSNGTSTYDLSVLSLRSNFFTGRIPNLSLLQNLQILDLSNNNLSGPIPLSLCNIKAMSLVLNTKVTNNSEFYLHKSTKLWTKVKGKEGEFDIKIVILMQLVDLSRNYLTGSIPNELMNLHGIQTLDLSRNHLTGHIPANVDKLSQLESLDLSVNMLSGLIPPNLASLHFLAFLNLSYNNLCGEIPTGNQLQTLGDPSNYEGNPNLCGFPLKKLCKKDKKHNGNSDEDNEHPDYGKEIIWLYMAIALGFIVGFWVFCGTLILHKRWRFAYFQAIDRSYDIFL